MGIRNQWTFLFICNYTFCSNLRTKQHVSKSKAKDASKVKFIPHGHNMQYIKIILSYLFPLP